MNNCKLFVAWGGHQARWLAAAAVGACTLLGAGDLGRTAMAADLPAAAAVDVDYERDIQPIFAEHCFKCHGPDRQRSDFRLDRADLLLRGGTSGEPAVMPGDSANSHLIRLVAGAEPDLVMPPDEGPLSDEEVALLRAWVDQGAVNPHPESNQEFTTDLWSFQPVAEVEVPDAGSEWAANEIDHFIYRKLEEAELEPSQDADRVSLIRRLYMVMHGLPPTVEQIEAFVADDRPDAYERLVERVLASPRYGERWGQHWLDVVRFAETNGFETNTPRGNAWPYRDWVIEAFNEDKPYDEFVYAQLAGDTTGEDEATGFLVAGPHDIVLSPDQGLTLMQRHDELASTVDTTGTAFLGLTMGCARCHNHMFDPVTQSDFYAMQAVFSGVKHGARAVAPSEEKREEAAELAQDIADVELKVAAIEDRNDLSHLVLREPVNATGNVDEFDPVMAKYVRFTILATNSSEPAIDELEIWEAIGDAKNAQNLALASNGAIPTASGTYPNSDIHKLEHINDGKKGNNHSWISNTNGKGWVQIELAQADVINRVTWARDSDGNFSDRLATQYRIEIAMEEGEWETVATSETRVSPNGDRRELLLAHLPADEAKAYKALTDQLDQMKRQRDALTQGATLYVGQFEQPAPTRRMYRGDPMSPREVVEPGGLSVLDGVRLAANAPERERRQALADWIASEENPLTARVMANRIWHYHFGTGIVSTPSDFGGNGSPPSHPELLDWLADEFVENDWSMKHVHRLILNSRTFRQASQPRSTALATDGDSRLLWRFPPRRAEAEMMRDSILQVTGALDLTSGGPSFNLFKANSNYVRVWEPLEEYGPEHFRRMVYMLRVRMEPEGIFGAFDMPDMAQSCSVRTESTTTLQAFNLFNSKFIIDQADRFADRLKQEAGERTTAQIERAFKLTTGRGPDRMERNASAALIEEHGLRAFTRAMLNTSEFFYIP